MHSKIYIVLVEYSSAQKSRANKYFDGLKGKFEFELIRVRTDLTPGSIIQNLNEGYEFSGYQEGLAKILSRVNDHQSKSAKLKIIFLNDTFFSSHFRIFSNILLRLLATKKHDVINKFIGIESSFRASFNSSTENLIYISTWAFALIGSLEDFARVVFYDLEEVSRFYGGDSRSEYSLKYKNAVDEWLNPSRFMRGWYKSSLRHSLEPETLRRKQITIYFEHTLPQRLAHAGFVGQDVVVNEHYFTCQTFKLLKFSDRLLLQCKKFSHRSVINIQATIFALGDFLKK